MRCYRLVNQELNWFQILDSSLQGICIIDENYNIVEVNKTFALIFSVDKKHIVGKKCFDIYSGQFCNTAKCLLTRIVNGEQKSLLERDLCNFAGKQIPSIVTARPYYNCSGEIVGMIQEVTDTTKLKQAEFALHETETKFKIYVDKSPDGIFIVNGKGDYVDVNPCGCSMLGYSRVELLKKNLQEISMPNDGVSHFKKLKETGEIIQEKYLIKKDGTQLPVELKAVSLGNDLYMEYVRDISERKQFETALRKSEEQYRVIFANSPLGVIHIDRTGCITHSNDKFIEILGSSREKIIGFNMLTQLQNTQMIAALQTALKDKVSHYQGIYTSVTSGKKLPLKAVFNCILSEKNEFIGAIGIFEDISQKVEIEKEMARLDSLNLIGQMAGGIGHEVRNPMTSVRGFLQLLANKENDSKKMEYYDIMIDELDRANSIITEFLSLARDRVVELRPTSLNAIINALYPLLSSDAMEQDRRIMLNKEDVPNIPLNEKEIRQLIINLVRNALEASPSAGVITISTYVSNGEVVLSVEDEGTGIPPEIYDKLGTPFVTTKDNGTGLGVSVCYSIAHKHNAKIDVKTGSTGTTFYVRFNIPQSQTAEQAS